MFIFGKDVVLEDFIVCFQQKLFDFGFDIEEVLWLNLVLYVWFVYICDKVCVLCFINGKGVIKKVVLVFVLGEYFECLFINYFFVDFWLGDIIVNGLFVYYLNEKWFLLIEDDEVLEGLLDVCLCVFYDFDDQLMVSMLVDLQLGNDECGVCGLFFICQFDGEIVYILMNIVGNLYVFNGMFVGNICNEVWVQGLLEVFECYIKNCIIVESISLLEILVEVMVCYLGVVELIVKLEVEGFLIFVYDGLFGGKYLVICVVLFNLVNGICFVFFGVYLDFGVVLE